MPTPPEPKRVAPKLETKTVSGLTGVKAAPDVYGHHFTYAGLPTVHHLGKREAEAEADPYDPYYAYTGYPYPYTGYPYTTYGYLQKRFVTPVVKAVPHVYDLLRKRVVTPVVKAVPHVYGPPLTY